MKLVWKHRELETVQKLYMQAEAKAKLQKLYSKAPFKNFFFLTFYLFVFFFYNRHNASCDFFFFF